MSLDRFDQIAAAQGWNEDTVLSMLREFVTDKALGGALAEHAAAVAAEENAGSDW